MIIIDKTLRIIGSGMINPFNEEKVGNTSYDLTAESFSVVPNVETDEVSLKPSESVFVKSEEVVTLPSDVCANVLLRNKHIRQGLSLDAPLYQPGHKTKVFFRVTNVSKNAITLKKGDGIASMMFYRLNETVEKPYSGAFQEEFEYKGMGKYSAELGKNMTDIEKKLDSVQQIEKNIYMNMLSLMGIFVAIFSLVNVNIQLAASQVCMKSILILNFVMIGAIGFLIAIVNEIIPNNRRSKIVWAASTLAFLIAIILQCVMH